MKEEVHIKRLLQSKTVLKNVKSSIKEEGKENCGVLPGNNNNSSSPSLKLKNSINSYNFNLNRRILSTCLSSGSFFLSDLNNLNNIGGNINLKTLNSISLNLNLNSEELNKEKLFPKNYEFETKNTKFFNEKLELKIGNNKCYKKKKESKKERLLRNFNLLGKNDDDLFKEYSKSFYSNISEKSKRNREIKTNSVLMNNNKNTLIKRKVKQYESFYAQAKQVKANSLKDYNTKNYSKKLAKIKNELIDTKQSIKKIENKYKVKNHKNK